MGCSKCSASRRQPPLRLISTSPVGFVHRTCRPSGPTQRLKMVSSTSVTCNAAFAEPRAAMAHKVGRACGGEPAPPGRREAARPETEGAGRRSSAGAAGLTPLPPTVRVSGSSASGPVSPRSWKSGQGFSGAVPALETASPSPAPWVNLFPAVASSATKSVSQETPFLPGSPHAREADVEEGMGSPGATGFVPHP